MEALAALSVAATAAQFLDCAIKTLSLCRQIRRNAKGATEANEEIERSIHEIEALQGRIQLKTPLTGASSQEIDIIAKTRSECDNAAKDLLKLLQDLKPGRKNKLRAALRVQTAQQRIDALQKRFDGCNEKLRTALEVDTRNHVLRILEEQGTIDDTIRHTLVPGLRAMRTESAEMHAITQQGTSSLTTDIVVSRD